MEGNYAFGCWPPYIGIGKENKAADSKAEIRFFINFLSPLEEVSREKQETDPCIRITFGLGDGEQDFFQDKEAADLAGVQDENWELTGREISEDKKEYTFVLEPKFTRSRTKDGLSESVCRLLFSSLCPNRTMGKANVKISIAMDGEKGSGVLEVEKIYSDTALQRFYAEPSCVASGEKITVYWEAISGENVSLRFEDKCIGEKLPLRGHQDISLSCSGRCRLFLDGEEIDSVFLQVLQVHLQRFDYVEEDGEISWDVYGAEKESVYIDGKEMASHGTKSVEPEPEETLICCLEAAGGGKKIKSYLAARKEVQGMQKGGRNLEMAISRFQKTILDFGSYQILHVSWETAGFEKIQLFFQDYERGHLFPLGERRDSGNGEEGEWEQVIFGDHVKITLVGIRPDQTVIPITI